MSLKAGCGLSGECGTLKPVPRSVEGTGISGSKAAPGCPEEERERETQKEEKQLSGCRGAPGRSVVRPRTCLLTPTGSGEDFRMLPDCKMWRRPRVASSQALVDRGPGENLPEHVHESRASGEPTSQPGALALQSSL